MFLDRLEAAGVSLEVSDAGKLRASGDLNDKRREYIRAHKQQLIVALRMRPIAEKHGLADLPEMMAFSSWYKDDLDDLAQMSDQDLEVIVFDYIENHHLYRPESQPFYVRCSDCQHFSLSDHPHLGRCAEKVPPPNCGMFWKSSWRCCDKYSASV